MGMRHPKQQRLKPLLDRVPPGFLVDAGWLRARGINGKSIHDYVARGWLERLVRGVYRRPLPSDASERDQVRWESVVLSLQRIMGHDIHLGGVSALELAGHIHYLHFGDNPPVHVYGIVPAWLRRLPCDSVFVIHRRDLFGNEQIGVEDINRNIGTTSQAVGVWRWPIRVSCPERAILETFDGLCNASSFDQVDKIFESLIVMRHGLLKELLVACRSEKVRQLFFAFADRHQHGWRKYLDSSRIDLGSGTRVLVKGGRVHPKYHIQIPQEFVP